MTRRRILVPIDLDAQSDSALDFARNIATRLNAMISCMYVIEEQKLRTNNPKNREAKLEQRRDVEIRLSEKVNSILSEAKTPFELIITHGKVHEKILEKSMDLNAQLIIMSRSNTGDIGKKRIGSITKHIITKSQIPVITIGRYKIVNRENIIVPLDVFKPIGSQVIFAIDTAMLLGAAVTVISVIEKEMLSLRPVYLKRLKEIRKLLRDIKIDCNSHLLTTRNTVPEEILSFSRKLDSAMILLMTSNEIKANGSSIGSVAKGIIAESELPVQCINPNCKSRNLSDKSGNFYKLDSWSWYSLKDHHIKNQQELET